MKNGVTMARPTKLTPEIQQEEWVTILLWDLPILLLPNRRHNISKHSMTG